MVNVNQFLVLVDHIGEPNLPTPALPPTGSPRTVLLQGRQVQGGPSASSLENKKRMEYFSFLKNRQSHIRRGEAPEVR
jgi:hypothetical protein